MCSNKFLLPDCDYSHLSFILLKKNRIKLTDNYDLKSYKEPYICNEERLYENNNIQMQSVNIFSITNSQLRNYSILRLLPFHRLQIR